MISATIRDAFTKRSATVDNEGALEVVVHPHPPLDESVYPLPYFQYFTDDGTSGGSNDMVDLQTLQLKLLIILLSLFFIILAIAGDIVGIVTNRE